MEAAEKQPECAPAEGRRERRRRELRVRIYKAARELFHDHGFEATTVEQIAARADIAPATFFNHFQSKGGILALMTSEAVDTLSAIVVEQLERPGSIRERLTGLAEHATARIQESHLVARDVMLEVVRTEGRPENTSPYLARLHDPIQKLLRDGQASGEIRTDEDSTFLAEMVLGGLNTVLTNWFADPNYPISERLPRAAAFVCDAIGAK